MIPNAPTQDATTCEAPPTARVAASRPRSKAPGELEFPNFWSRLLLKPFFEKQHAIPGQPPAALEAFLKFFERTVLRVRTDALVIDRPIFLIGLPRAGTTMLQDLLCLHPQVVYITNAMHQFRQCFCAVEVLRKRLRLNARGERFVGDSVEVEAGSPNEGLAFWGEWLKWDPFSLEYVPRRLSDYSEQHIESVHTAIRKIIWCFGRGERRFFSKNPGLIPDITLLNELFPDARFLHIVRDPRMNANSLLKLYRRDKEQLERIKAAGKHGIFDDRPFVPYPRLPRLAKYVETYSADDIRTTAHLWNDAISYVHERRHLLNSFHEVRYEDILANPQQELSKALDFCQLPPAGPENVKFWNKMSEVGVVHHQNQYGEFSVVEEICRDNMQKLGYC